MAKRAARQLTVTANLALTPNMRRVTLQGTDLSDFPAHAEGGYFKLVFPGGDPERPTLRTYTVSQYRRDMNEIDVDFMLHGDATGTVAGVAAAWALNARKGDGMSIFGPGPATFINTDADAFVLAADMTALPALTSNLKTLPADATGYVVIEILSEEDRQALTVPPGIEVVWVVNANPGSEESPLYHALTALDWPSGRVAVWCACEFKTMKKNRQYFTQRNIPKTHLYISSYWKKGLHEEEHKIAKREDVA